MLQVPFIRANKDLVVERLKIRNFPENAALEILNKIIAEDDVRKEAQTELDKNLAEAKQIANEIGALYKQGKRAEADELKAKVAGMKDYNKDLETKMNEAEHNCEELLLQVPNVPHPSVPPGNTDEDNEVYQDWPRALPTVADDAIPHWELAQKYNLFDLELGVKITGAGFPLYRGKGAKLQRALINFFLDEATKAGYEEIIPPLLVNEASARATGQLPDKEGQMYH